MSKALIVDDHPVNLYLLRSLLTGSGYEVVEARDGKEALDLARTDRPDIIISDILMPVMDGFALCRACRQDGSLIRVPFVFYTATYTDPRDEQFALSAGADLFLVKPTEPTLFLRRIQEVLDLCHRGGLTHTSERPPDDATFLKEYNGALVRKLEDKVAAVAEANRALLVKEAALESSRSGIAFVDPAGVVTFMNRAMLTLVGEQAERQLGKPIESLFGEHATAQILGHRTLGSDAWSGDMELVDRAGVRRVLQVRAHVVRDADGVLICRMLAVDDITERQRMIEDVQRSQRLASLSLFAAGIAHDFNNLLTAIFANLELAREEIGDDHPAVMPLDQASVAFERARDLTRRILTFAKGTPSAFREHAVSQVVRDCCGLALAGSRVQCTMQGAEVLWPAVGDANQLSQVFTNLLINARQAMHDAGHVRIDFGNIEVSRPDGAHRMVRITVTDDGPGIPADVLPHIFDPLYTTKPDGLGLGLATCQSIIEAHGGRIVVSSSGDGASFEVTLPAGAGQAIAGVPPPLIEDSADAPMARVLVMDDERLLRDVAGQMLKRGGCEVWPCSTGEEALALCAKADAEGRPVDVAVLDVTVPGGLGGKETARVMAERHPATAVVLSSGYGKEALAIEDCPVAAVLPKPYQAHELLACVRAAMRRR